MLINSGGGSSGIPYYELEGIAQDVIEKNQKVYVSNEQNEWQEKARKQMELSITSSPYGFLADSSKIVTPTQTYSRNGVDWTSNGGYGTSFGSGGSAYFDILGNRTVLGGKKRIVDLLNKTYKDINVTIPRLEDTNVVRISRSYNVNTYVLLAIYQNKYHVCYERNDDPGNYYISLASISASWTTTAKNFVVSASNKVIDTAGNVAQFSFSFTGSSWLYDLVLLQNLTIPTPCTRIKFPNADVDKWIAVYSNNSVHIYELVEGSYTYRPNAIDSPPNNGIDDVAMSRNEKWLVIGAAVFEKNADGIWQNTGYVIPNKSAITNDYNTRASIFSMDSKYYFYLDKSGYLCSLETGNLDKYKAISPYSAIPSGFGGAGIAGIGFAKSSIANGSSGVAKICFDK